MVAAAKIEREAVEKKNEQLRSQIKDTESLLASHQDQLAELKSVMQGMHLTKDDLDIRTNASTTPSSPAGPPQSQRSAKHDSEFENVAMPTYNPEELIPGPSCNFPQLLRTVCRTDLQAYDDFRELLVISRNSKPPSRAGSGSYGGLNVMGLAGFGGGNSVTSSPTKATTHSPNGSLSSQTGSHIPLKETRFYKRVLMEDIEPTLRLDLAPGISWLTRRTVLSGVCEGTLVVEPTPALAKKYEFPCAVCGERRSDARNERSHRFRTSDSETAQRYPLCIQCLERVRACCEFTGYLRLILDGHVRANDLEEERDVWEETVRLRERMFWSRIAAGILPVVGQPAGSETAPDQTGLDTGDLQGHPSDEPLEAADKVDSETQADESVSPADTTRFDDETSVAHHSVSDFDGIKPVTPDLPHLSKDDEISTDERMKRQSADSDMSIYEEAPADISETTESQPAPDHEQPA